MAVDTKKLIVVILMLCGASLHGSSRGPQGSALQPQQRIISLIPSVTEMLFAIGAGADVVAVSSYDEFPPAVNALPKVGALLDPDVERIIALRPTLVATYGTQTDLEAQLHRAGIRTFSYRHAGIAGVMKSLRDLGASTGHRAQADTVAREVQAQLDAIAATVRGRPRPRVLLVFGGQPQSLQQIYVSGGTGFLHDMLTAAGGVNVLADTKRESVQPSQETLLTLAPDVIVELRSAGPATAAEIARERSAWAPLGSVPAVRNGRIYFLNGEYMVVPGPRVGKAAEALARVLHPDAFK
jgi:iron complex transport system substrate-binding protein